MRYFIVRKEKWRCFLESYQVSLACAFDKSIVNVFEKDTWTEER
jgi:hypothetical protein